ncbi:MAG: DUF4112 domain-containing protein [Candidatus Rokuibacteriota bacterium]
MSGPGRREDPLERLTHLLDRVFRVPGTGIRFGLDPILGLLFPVGGDVLTALLAAYIVLEGVRAGLPRVAIARMVFNVAVDVVLGSVPLVGDVFDAAWKANDRNLRLLRRYATQRRRRAQWHDWAWALALLGVLALVLVGAAALAVYALAALGVDLF